MERKEIKFPRLISNRPCNQDLFEGNAHDKLAKAIADVISSDEKPSMIGIDGGWGSGKSNLVGMVTQSLKEHTDKQYHFFTYDAWGHQGDLPRRSILEELTTRLTKDKSPALEGEYWDNKLNDLLARKKHTQTKVVPRLNLSIVGLSILIFITPFINTLASEAPNKLIAYLTVIIPYILITGWVFIDHYLGMKKYGQTITVKSFFIELFHIYNDEIKEDIKYETISEREPSSEQFIGWIKDINTSLKENNRYLVIVFDNMDRLPRVKVQELWAAIHTFFSEANYTNITVIVPFDRAHIQNAFQSEDIEDNDGNESKSKPRICYGNDFINKTFDIVFSVPPPILSGWKNYFRDMWKKAFGPDVDADPDVLQIFDKLTQENSPRKIIAFINSFVTLKKTADSSIEDKYIALYIFGREHIAKKPFSQILSPTYLGALEFLYKNDQRMQECMSSLYYQLPSNDAMDVIFSNQIKIELDNNTPDIIVKLKTSNNYWSILFNAIPEVTNIKNATLTLNSVLVGTEEKRASKAWSDLFKKAISNKDNLSEYDEYHKILASKLTLEERRTLVEILIRQYHKNIDSKPIDNYIHGIDELSSIENDVYKILKEYNTEVEAQDYLTLVKQKKDQHTHYGLTVNPAKFDTHLLNLSPDVAATTSIYPHIKDTIDTPKYEERMSKLFKDATHSDLENAQNLIDRIKEIIPAPIAISIYWDDNKIYNMFVSATKDNDIYYEAIAMMISRWDKFSANRSSFNTILNSSDIKVAQKVAKVIESYTTYGEILEKFSSYPQNALLKLVVKELTIARNGESKLAIESVLPKYETIIDNSDVTASELLSKLNGWSKHLNKKDRSYIESLPLQLFVDAQTVDNPLTRYCLQIAQDYLRDFSQEEWKSSFANEDYKFKLLKVYHPCPIANCFDAFKQITRDYANGTATKFISPSVTEDITNISKEVGRNLSEFFTSIRDIFISSASITPEKIKYFGKLLFEYAKLEESPQSLEKIFPTEYIDDDEIILLLIENKEKIKVLVANSQNSYEFRQKIESLLTGRKKSDKQFIDFCASIGIHENSEEISSEA